MRAGLRLTALLGFFAFLALPSAGGAAPAPDKSKASYWIKEAEQLYQAGRFHEAAEALLKAQKLEPHPRLIYNIARAYDQAGELMGALDYYQQYVNSKEGTDVQLLKRSALAIDRLQKLLRQQEEQRANSEAERQRLMEETRVAQERAGAEAAAKRKAEEENQERARAQLQASIQGYQRGRTVSLVAGGAALAGVVAGAVFGILATQSKADFVEAADVAAKQQAEGLTRQRALIADVGFAVGLAGAVTAFLTYPRGLDPAKGTVLTLGPGSARLEVKF